MAWSRSDTAVTMVASLPPVSAKRFSRGLSPQHRERRCGAAGEDDRVDLADGSTSSRPSLPPEQGTNCSAFFETPARQKHWHSSHATSTVSEAGLRMTVLPAASAAATPAAGNRDREVPRRNHDHHALAARLERRHLLPPLARCRGRTRGSPRPRKLRGRTPAGSCRRWPAPRPSGRARALRSSCATLPNTSNRSLAGMDRASRPGRPRRSPRRVQSPSRWLAG